jgi:AraC-like DNA-binding protein
MILIGLFKNPEVLFGLPNFNKNIMEEREGQKIIKHQAAFNPEKYYSPISTLTKSQVDQYATILSNYMEGPEKPFTKHNFNIKDLSNGSGIPQHHLAYFFRYHFTEGFVDYRNRHRFNEVLNKIHQGEFKKKTLEGIASESGFASRITFFNVFKKHTGMSASDYIEKMKQR